MKMNWVEKMMMNNPIREAFQVRYEVPLLEKLGGRTEGLHVLEVGCGRGVGTEQIFKRFGAASVHAIDIDNEMIERARHRLSSYSTQQLKIECGDVTAIEAPDESFDAVFDFAILHHVPIWQNAITEIRRVLRPGGHFYFHEVTSHFLNKWIYKTILEHPIDNRFSGAEFIAELEKQNLSVSGRFVEKKGGDFVFGVATKI